MDTIALSLTMKRLVRWLDHRCQPDDLVGRQFDAPPFGRCYVTIDPERQRNVGSINLNRVYLCGTEAGLDAGSFARLIDLFTASGIRKFFVWLSSSPNVDTVRGWLEIARRIERAEWSGCSMLVSETLSILEHSLRNLQRAGFRQVFEKEVYQWNG